MAVSDLTLLVFPFSLYEEDSILQYELRPGQRIRIPMAWSQFNLRLDGESPRPHRLQRRDMLRIHLLWPLERVSPSPAAFPGTRKHYEGCV